MPLARSLSICALTSPPAADSRGESPSFGLFLSRVLTIPCLCGLQPVEAPREVASFSAHRALACPLASVYRRHARPPPCSGLSHLLPASPYAPGSSASDFAAVAFSAPLADSTLAVPSAMASAALTTGGAPLVRSCQCLGARLPSCESCPSRRP